MSLRNLTGCRFGKLLVTGRNDSNPSRHVYWFTLCDCGTRKSVRGGHLNAGRIVSCGCHRPTRTHGMHESREYTSWEMMIQRCTNPQYDSFKDYGARGIKICERWRGLHGFENFFHDLGKRPAGQSLERVNNDGNYEPSNCKWATQSEQLLNTRRSLKNRKHTETTREAAP